MKKKLIRRKKLIKKKIGEIANKINKYLLKMKKLERNKEVQNLERTEKGITRKRYRRKVIRRRKKKVIKQR